MASPTEALDGTRGRSPDGFRGRVRTRIRRRLRDPGTWLWTVAGVCWVALLVGGHRHGGPAPGVPTALGVLLLAGAWLEMIAAMMLPTAIPMVRMFTAASARAPRPAAARAAFLGGYLALWLAFSLGALAASLGLRAWAVRQDFAWLHTHPGLPLGAALAVAGIFQFSPLKDRCLTECRDPRAFLFSHYRRGVRGGWALGVRHGWSCLGCCWALMAIMFVTGLGSIAVMLVLTAVMLAEKVTAWGARIVAPVGVALLIAAAAVAVSGSTLGGWVTPAQHPAGTHLH